MTISRYHSVMLALYHGGSADPLSRPRSDPPAPGLRAPAGKERRIPDIYLTFFVSAFTINHKFFWEV